MAIIPAGSRLDGSLMTAAMYSASASASPFLTTTVTDVTGASVTVTARTSSAIYLATISVDFSSSGTTVTTGVGTLDIDGVDQAATALFANGGISTTRATCSQSYTGTLSAGSHTFKIQASRVGGADSMIRVNSLHTTINVLVIG